MWLIAQIDQAEQGKKGAFRNGEPVWIVVYDSNHKVLSAALRNYRKFITSSSSPDVEYDDTDTRNKN